MQRSPSLLGAGDAVHLVAVVPVTVTVTLLCDIDFESVDARAVEPGSPLPWTCTPMTTAASVEGAPLDV